MPPLQRPGRDTTLQEASEKVQFGADVTVVCPLGFVQLAYGISGIPSSLRKMRRKCEIELGPCRAWSHTKAHYQCSAQEYEVVDLISKC